MAQTKLKSLQLCKQIHDRQTEIIDLIDAGCRQVENKNK